MLIFIIDACEEYHVLYVILVSICGVHYVIIIHFYLKPVEIENLC